MCVCVGGGCVCVCVCVWWMGGGRGEETGIPQFFTSIIYFPYTYMQPETKKSYNSRLIVVQVTLGPTGAASGHPVVFQSQLS